MMFRVTYNRVQDDGVTLQVWGTAATKKVTKPIHLSVRRYTGPLGFFPGCETPIPEHELHRLARTRGTVLAHEGITEQDAHDMAWDVAGYLRAGRNPVGEWKVWNLPQVQ